MKNHRVIEGIVVTLLFAAMVLGVTIGTGAMFSGWHFVDDHEILEWMLPIRNGEKTALEELLYLLPEDYGNRFRPLYYPIRFLTFLVLGDNLVIYEVLKSLEAILGMVLLYYVGKTCGGSACTSLAFSLLSMTGYQSAIWWKLGPQEPQGVLYFALGMLLLNAYLKCGKRWIAVLSWVSLLIMSNWKESYICLFPFVILYVLYRGMPAEGTLWERIRSGIRSHWAYITACAVTCIVEVTLIVVLVGTNNSSGAGVSSSIGIRTILDSYWYAFSHDLKYYYVVTLIIMAILLTYWTDLKAMWLEIILFLSFLLPQLLIYGKEAMAERYIIPSSIGYSLFYVIVVFRKGILNGKRKLVYELALLALFVLGLRSAYIEADYYRFRGDSVTTAMEYASETGAKGARVLSLFSYTNPEAQRTMNAWMEWCGELDQLYYWDETDHAFYDAKSYTYMTGLDEHEQAELDDIDVVMTYNADDRHYIGMCDLVSGGFLDEEFTKVTCGSVDIYVRNGSGQELPDADIAYPVYY